MEPNEAAGPNVSAQFLRLGTWSARRGGETAGRRLICCDDRRRTRPRGGGMITAEPAAPRPVRAAGVLVVLQGLAGVAVAAGLLVAAVRGSTSPGWGPFALAACLACFGGILLVVGANLVRGRRGARTPVIVAQLLLLGVCWDAAGPSSQPVYGVPAAAFCVAVLVLLFCPPALRWATRTHRQAR
jgi:hypothetical protein